MENYQTKDLPLIAFLAYNGIKACDIFTRGGVIYYLYKRTEYLDQMIFDFTQEQVKVEPNLYLRKYRQVRREIENYLNNGA